MQWQRFSNPMAASNPAGDDHKSLRDALEKSFIIVAGEGSIDLNDSDPVHISVVYDVQGYGPHTAAIYAVQNRYHGTTDTALQGAHELLEQWELDYHKDDGYLKELEDEYGERWMEVLMETSDGMWWTLSPEQAATAIKGTKAAKFIDIYEKD